MKQWMLVMQLKTAVQTPKTTSAGSSQLMIWLLSITVVIFVIWASLTSIDQIVRGPGKLVPTSNTQVIQNLEGGLLSELLVTEGQIVEKDQILARLSDKRFKAAFEELESEVLALEIKLKRLEAEINQEDNFFIPDDLKQQAKEVSASETQLFYARSLEFESAKESLEKSLQLFNREEAILAKSVKRRIAPEIDLVKARQSRNDIKSQLSALTNEFMLTRTEEHAKVLTELNQARANYANRKDQLFRTTLTAPTRGIVNKVLITTIGGVAPPGEPILELTPLEDDLQIEAEISPKDVAFIYPGMRSTIKLTAYDYTIYGSFSGKVIHVSADTFEKQNTREPEPYYKVLIELDKDALETKDKKIEIRPGMLADTELHVGKNTIMSYLLKPLFKASQAFREQ